MDGRKEGKKEHEGRKGKVRSKGKSWNRGIQCLLWVSASALCFLENSSELHYCWNPIIPNTLWLCWQLGLVCWNVISTELGSIPSVLFVGMLSSQVSFLLEWPHPKHYELERHPNCIGIHPKCIVCWDAHPKSNSCWDESHPKHYELEHHSNWVGIHPKCYVCWDELIPSALFVGMISSQILWIGMSSQLSWDLYQVCCFWDALCSLGCSHHKHVMSWDAIPLTSVLFIGKQSSQVECVLGLECHPNRVGIHPKCVVCCDTLIPIKQYLIIIMSWDVIPTVVISCRSGCSHPTSH